MTISAKKTTTMIIQKNTFVGPLKQAEIASDRIDYKNRIQTAGCAY